MRRRGTVQLLHVTLPVLLLLLLLVMVTVKRGWTLNLAIGEVGG